MEVLIMPGIAGIISSKKYEDIDIRGLLKKMATSMKHRKDYKDELWVHNLFGFTRTQPKSGFNPEQQPIFNENRDLAVFMYGVIYDYDNELEILKGKGHQFQYENDPEFFLHLYEEVGDKAVENLNGSFCIVLFNLKTRQLKIFTDRFGSRPLYYYYDEKEGRFLFASEVKAILKYKSVNKEINYDAIAHFMTFGHLLGEETFFRHINLIPTATIMTITDDGISTMRYHELRWIEDSFKSIEFYGEKYAKSFTKAVKRRWEKGKKVGKVGIMLSGGLDSRIILAALLYEGYSPSEINCVTMGVGGTHEPTLTKKVADAVGATFRFVAWKDPANLLKEMIKTAYIGDGMTWITAGLYLWGFERYKEYFDIVLNGYGPDPGLCEGIHYVHQGECRSKKDLVKRIMNTDPLVEEEYIKKLFMPDIKRNIRNWASDAVSSLINSYHAKYYTNLWDNFYIYQRLRRVNLNAKNLLRCVMEEDSPIYDNDVMDVYTTIPPEFRYFKYGFFRNALSYLSKKLSRIPQESTRLPPSYPVFMWKFGMWLYEKKLHIYEKMLAIPFIEGLIRTHLKKFRFGYGQSIDWIKEDEKWKKFIDEVLFDGRLEKRNIFDMKMVRKVVTEFFSSHTFHPKKLRLIVSFLNVEIWFRFFVDDDYSLAKKWGGFVEQMEVS